jgi:hypothetical protein
LPQARRLLVQRLVLSGLETFVAFMILLGVLLRPLAPIDKHP